MEYQKVIKMLDTKSDNVSIFITKKWIKVHDQTNKIYSTNKKIRFKASMLQSDYVIPVMDVFCKMNNYYCRSEW